MTTTARRKLLTPITAGVATLSTLATIGPVFSQQNWIPTSIAVLAAIVVSGIVLRAFGLSHAVVSLLQLVIGLYTLVAIACHSSMVAGFIPTGDTIDHFVALIQEGAHTARTKVAPIPPTAGTAALLALLVTPIAVLVDDFAITGRPALTGIPLLTLFAICAAIVRQPISMWLVAIPLVAFVLLLWLANDDEPAERRGPAPLTGLLTTAVVLVVGLSVAAAVTVVVRLQDGGLFAVAGTKRAPNETVARTTDLVGQLSRGEPIPLFTVTTDDPTPYYLRTLVLENWGTQGWSFANTQDADVDMTDIPPGELSQSTALTHTTITVDQYSDVFVPAYYSPASVGLAGAQYDADMSVVYTDDKGDIEGRTYEVVSRVPRPTEAELAAAPRQAPASMAQNLVVPNDVDDSVIALTNSVLGSASTPWQIAVALDEFFSDPAQGFVYDLEVPNPGDADPLASFLDNRVGFCEQYASAMASMFRIGGVPARVVVGYSNGETNEDGAFEITTDDAHAWVEAYFSGVGWVPFDPTPIGDRAAPLPYVSNDDTGSEPGQSTGANTSQSAPESDAAPTDTAAQDPSAEAADEAAGPAADAGIRWASVARWTLLVLAVAAIVVLPAVLREARWRRRLAAAAAGGRDGALSAWREIRELAGALGAPEVTVLSERAQAQRWAASLAGARSRAPERLDEDLAALALAAERARYGGDDDVDPVDDQLRRARSAIRSGVGLPRWVRAVAVPRLRR